MSAASTSAADSYPPAALDYLTSHAIDPQVARDLGVEADTETISYPVIRKGGTCYRRTRILATGKTRQPKGEELALWWPHGRPSGRVEAVLVTEGESDALAAVCALGGAPHGFDGVQVVGVPGASFPAGRLADELVSIGVQTVFLAMDGDKPGRACADRATQTLRGKGIRTAVVEMPDGLDLSDVLVAIEPERRQDELAGRLAEADVHAEGSVAEDPHGGQLRHPDPARARPVRWAWTHRIALGKLNLIVGNEGAGKGVLVAYLAAQLSHGTLDGDLHGGPTNVLIVGDEDALDDTWTPRLSAAGANWKRIFFPPANIDDVDISGSGMKSLSHWVNESGADVVVFDAILDNLGVVDTYKAKEVRAGLRPVRQLAAELDIAVIGAMHPKKGEAPTFRDLLANSHQFNAVSRSSLLLAEHPDDERRRVLVRGKGNLSRAPQPLEFEIRSRVFELNGDTFDQPVTAEWGDSDVEIESVLPSKTRETKQDAAARWLCAYLAPPGVWKPSAEVKKAAAESGIKEHAIKRAFKELVADGVADYDDTKEVPRRTLWQLVSAESSRDNFYPPEMSRLEEPALQSEDGSSSQVSRDSQDNGPGWLMPATAQQEAEIARIEAKWGEGAAR